MKLRLLEPILPEAIFDQRYNTPNNVTGEDLYFGQNPLRLDEPTAEKLVRGHKIALSKGLVIVVFDAFRTKDAHDKLIQVCPDPDYVDPNSLHLTGNKVDVTLADRRTGVYLDMGSDFDEFSEKSHVDAGGLSELQRTSQLLLRNLMASVGLVHHTNEWWDYTDKDFISSI